MENNITNPIEDANKNTVVDDSSSTTDSPSSIPSTPITPAKPSSSSIPSISLTPAKPTGKPGHHIPGPPPPPPIPYPIPGGIPPLPYPPNFCGTGLIPPAPYGPSFIGDPYYYWYGRPQIMDIYGHVNRPKPIRPIDPPNGSNIQNVARPYDPRHDDDNPLYNEINRPITEEDLTVINIDSKIIPTLKLKIYRINSENDSELILEVGKKYVVRYLTRIGLDTVVGKLLTFKASQNETRHINSYEQNDGDSYFIRLDCSTEGNSKIVDVLLKNLRSIKEFELPKDDDNKDNPDNPGTDTPGDDSGEIKPPSEDGDNSETDKPGTTTPDGDGNKGDSSTDSPNKDNSDNNVEQPSTPPSDNKDQTTEVPSVTNPDESSKDSENNISKEA